MLLQRLIAITLLTLAGCSETVPLAAPQVDATGKQFAAPVVGRAAVYVYRPDKSGSVFEITLNQRTLGTLAAGTYLRADVPAGNYDMRCRSSVAGDAGARRQLSLAESSITFVSATFTVNNPHCSIQLSDPVTGRAGVTAAQRAQEVGGASD